jgi:hypothetical protein
MERLWQVLEETPLPTGTFTIQGVLLSLLLAFVLGQALAWIYYLTHSGLSYSRSFVQSLVIITIVVAMVMSVIGNNIITAVGLLGAFTIIRFRNMLKDTRDIAFMFTALAVGMATGCRLYATAILGTVFVCVIFIYLHFTDFGSHEPHNGFLRFTLKGQIRPGHPVQAGCRLWGGGGVRLSGHGPKSRPKRTDAGGAGAGRRRGRDQPDDAGEAAGGLAFHGA